MVHRDDEGPKPSPLRLFDPKWVAELLGISLSTVRREIRLRRLPCHRIGRAVRVSAADLEAYLVKRRRYVR